MANVTVITRASKGSKLTSAEADANVIALAGGVNTALITAASALETAGGIADIANAANTLSGQLSDTLASAQGDITGLQNLLSDPASGIEAKVNNLGSALTDPSTGVQAQLQTIQAVLNTPDTGLVAEMATLTSSINTPDTGVTARLTTLDEIVTTPTSGLVDRLATLAATINTPTTGVTATLSTLDRIVTTPTTGLVDQITSLSSKVTDLTTGSVTGADFNTLNEVVTTPTTGLVDQLTTLKATMTTPGTGVLAQLSTLNAVVVAPGTGLVSQFSDLKTAVNDPTTGLAKATADLNTLNSVVTDPTHGLAKQVTDLTATVNDPSTGLAQTAANLSTLNTTVTDPTSGLVKQVTDLKAVVNDPTTGLATVSAQIGHALSTYSDPNKASASDVTNLQVEVHGTNGTGGIKAQVQTLTNTVATLGGAVSTWSVNFDTNGNVSGLAFTSTTEGGNTTSDFKILASTFELVDAANPTSTIYPFSYAAGVLTFNGKVQINGSTTFAAGYDPSGKVAVGESAADVNAGTTTINGGKITAHTVSINELDFTPVTDGDVVASINASAEGIRISGAKIQIDGSVVFSAGYDPSGKIAAGSAAADVNAGTTTINGGKITAHTVSINELDFTPVTGSDVVASINASAEGIRIAGAKIEIDGSVTFSAGYDPSGKLAAGGAAADVNAGTTTINGGMITAHTVTLDHLNFTPVTGPLAGQVIAAINASTEGLQIAANKVVFQEQGAQPVDIESSNYVPGSAGTPGSGFKLESQPFNATLLDGTVIPVLLELAGEASLGGYEAGGMAFSRLAGGGVKVFTNQTVDWVCPLNVHSVTVTLVGGGGGSVLSSDGLFNLGGGSGGSVIFTTAVTPGQTYHIVAGGPGAGHTSGWGSESTIGTGLYYPAGYTPGYWQDEDETIWVPGTPIGTGYPSYTLQATQASGNGGDSSAFGFTAKGGAGASMAYYYYYCPGYYNYAATPNYSFNAGQALGNVFGPGGVSLAPAVTSGHNVSSSASVYDGSGSYLTIQTGVTWVSIPALTGTFISTAAGASATNDMTVYNFIGLTNLSGGKAIGVVGMLFQVAIGGVSGGIHVGNWGEGATDGTPVPIFGTVGYQFTGGGWDAASIGLPVGTIVSVADYLNIYSPADEQDSFTAVTGQTGTYTPTYSSGVIAVTPDAASIPSGSTPGYDACTIGAPSGFGRGVNTSGDTPGYGAGGGFGHDGGTGVVILQY